MSKQVIFIDRRVENYQTLLDSFDSDFDFYLLESDEDGVVQIAHYLQNYEALDAIHIISHGDVASLLLGARALNQDNIQSYQATLNQIGSHLNEAGDILLYGCNVAADEQGQAFVSQLAELTGADVAASNNLTGNSAKGGDWILEETIGAIESSSVIGTKTQTDYKDVLFSYVSTANSPGWANAIAVANNYACTANGSEGLRIFDVSNPQNPKEVGFYKVNGHSRDVAVVDTTAFVAAGSGGLQIINISSPSNPTLVGNYAMSGGDELVKVKVVGNTAFLVGLNSFELVNISNLNNPTLLSNINYYSGSIKGAIIDIAVQGSTLIVCSKSLSLGGAYQLKTIDISTPSNPILLASRDISLVDGSPESIAVSGNTAYVSCRADGIKLFDITNPSNPQNLGGSSGFSKSAIVHNDTIISSGGGSADMLDVSSLTRLDSVDLNSDASQGYVEDIAIKGHYAYIANGNGGLKVVDLTRQADLIVTSVSEYPSVITQGQDFSVTYAYKNIGNSLSGSHSSAVYLDGQLIMTNMLSSPISPSQIVWWMANFNTTNLSSGLHQLMIRADVSNSVAESNELNNEAYISFTVQAANRAPIVSAYMQDAIATEGSVFSYTVPSNTFSDPDGNTLTYSAKLMDGNSLPAWISFDSASRTFSGTAPSNTPDLNIRVTATDSGGLSVYDEATLSTPANTSNLPKLWVSDWRGLEDVTGHLLNLKGSNNASSRDSVVRVFLDAPAATDIAFTAKLQYGTADSNDIAGLSTTGQVFTIKAGESGVDIPIVLLRDYDTEHPKTFNVLLSNISGASAVRSSALGIIINNDMLTSDIDNLIIGQDTGNTFGYLNESLGYVSVYGNHAGIDLNVPESGAEEDANSPVFGEVVQIDASTEHDWGGMVAIGLPLTAADSTQDTFLFVHNTETPLVLGQLVNIGTYIGHFGQTSYTPHIHIESKTDNGALGHSTQNPEASGQASYPLNQDPRIPIAIANSNRYVSQLIGLSGDTISEAESYGLLPIGTTELYDVIGGADKIDYYRFYVDSYSQFATKLSWNTETANPNPLFHFYRADGTEITNTANISSFSDGVLTSRFFGSVLAPGEYFVKVDANASADTTYRLRFSHKKILDGVGGGGTVETVASLATGNVVDANSKQFGLEYIASHSDLMAAFGANAAAGTQHYLNWGYSEGRGVTFDGLKYIASHGDLIGAFGANVEAGVTHYINYGFAEGRSVTFDGLKYIASNSDLIGAFGTNVEAATQHYINYGANEGRGMGFDALKYIASNGDLIGAFGTNVEVATQHYINYGANEGRGMGFDALKYIASYPDLINAYCTDTNAATLQYIQQGAVQGRPLTFDAKSYLDSYADLKSAFGNNLEAANLHYIQYGAREGRVPFDALKYIASYPDLIMVFGTDTVAATEHYQNAGRYEGRAISFDALQYLNSYADLKSAFGFNTEAATLHYIQGGFAEGRSPTLLPSTTFSAVTPIVLDLNHDGIHTLARGDATFDLLGNGKPISSGWVSEQDGLLAVDHNQNGKIDSIHELLGGLNKGDGFAKLASFDTNNDGQVSVDDARFADLLVWRDANSNHITDEGELMSLSDAHIARLNIAFIEQPELDSNGNLHLERSTAILANGTEIDMTDVYFNVLTSDAIGISLPSMSELLSSDSSLNSLLGETTSSTTASTDTSHKTLDIPALNQWGSLYEQTALYVD